MDNLAFKCLVEFIGTLGFLYTIIYTGNYLAIGAALAIAILLGGKYTGGHFNPAVSIMMCFAKKLPVKDLLPYIISQVLAGLCAYELYKRVKK